MLGIIGCFYIVEYFLVLYIFVIVLCEWICGYFKIFVFILKLFDIENRNGGGVKWKEVRAVICMY